MKRIRLKRGLDCDGTSPWVWKRGRFRRRRGGTGMRAFPERISRDGWVRTLGGGASIAGRILGNETDADEAVGRAIEKVAKSKAEPERIEPYFLTVVKGEAKRIFRKIRGNSVINVEVLERSDGGRRAAELEQKEAAEIAMRILSERDRIIFKMYYWESKSFEEIGRSLGVNPSTVRVRHMRALEKLRERAVTIFGSE